MDESDEWRVVAAGHNVIFHHDDKLAPSIDWKTAQVTEKIGNNTLPPNAPPRSLVTKIFLRNFFLLDGHQAILYSYKGIWFVSSKKTPDGVERCASGETVRTILFVFFFFYSFFYSFY